MATILSIVGSSFQAHAEQDVSEARASDVESDGEDHPASRAQASTPRDSALDCDEQSAASPHDLPPFLSAPSTRIRRRSEIAFSRPHPKSASQGPSFHDSIPIEPQVHASQHAYELTDFHRPPAEKLNFVKEDVEVGINNADKDQSGATTPRAPSLAYEQDEGAQPSASQRARFRKYGRIHMVALAWCFYLNGWNDGTIGPLLPRIQEYYNIGFVVVSMIFVVNCFGFIFGATANVYLSDKLGFGKVMVLGAVAQAITYAMQIPEGPFAVRVVAYFLAGFGVAIQNAGMNGYAGSLKKNTAKKLGLLHGSYGIGAFTAPLASTYFSTATHWSYHFIISLGFAILNIVVLVAVFRGRLLDEVLVEEGEEPGEVQVVQAGVARESKFKQIFTSRIVHYMAMFSIIYIGVEVTVGGWIVTFIIRERQGGPNAGYISSGFFGGLAAGRLGLVWINQKIGERRALFIYSIICIALEATVWAVPSLIENAVAVSLIGVLLGPMYPILVNYAKDVLPRWLLTGSLGWIVGIGQAGSAALPFVTGLLAAKYGIVSLQPLLISMMILMVGLWALIPKAQRRVD